MMGAKQSFRRPSDLARVMKMAHWRGHCNQVFSSSGVTAHHSIFPLSFSSISISVIRRNSIPMALELCVLLGHKKREGPGWSELCSKSYLVNGRAGMEEPSPWWEALWRLLPLRMFWFHPYFSGRARETDLRTGDALGRHRKTPACDKWAAGARMPSSASSLYHVRHIVPRPFLSSTAYVFPLQSQLRQETTDSRVSSRSFPGSQEKRWELMFLPVFHEAPASSRQDSWNSFVTGSGNEGGMLPKWKGCPPQVVHITLRQVRFHTTGSSGRHVLSPWCKHTDHPAQLIGSEVLFCSVEHGTRGTTHCSKHPRRRHDFMREQGRI